MERLFHGTEVRMDIVFPQKQSGNMRQELTRPLWGIRYTEQRRSGRTGKRFVKGQPGRSLHTLSTAWGFLIMVLHLGLHMYAPLEKLRKKAENTMFEYSFYLFFAAMMFAGTYCFAKSSLWQGMFLRPKGNPAFSQPVFYAQYIMITIAACQVMYLLRKTFGGLRRKS